MFRNISLFFLTMFFTINVAFSADFQVGDEVLLKVDNMAFKTIITAIDGDKVMTDQSRSALISTSQITIYEKVDSLTCGKQLLRVGDVVSTKYKTIDGGIDFELFDMTTSNYILTDKSGDVYFEVKSDCKIGGYKILSKN